MTALPLPPGVNLLEGWGASAEYGDNRFVVINAPTFGYVTVDLDSRCARAGCSTTSKAISTKSYRGRGWRVKLFNDAIAYLNKLAGSVGA